MSIRIQEVDTRVASDDVLRELWGFYPQVWVEQAPDDPPPPFERTALDWRHYPADEDVPRWILKDADEVVGVAVAAVALDQDLENGFGRVHVAERHRGRGHGRRLAEPVIEYLEAGNRKRFATSTTSPSTAAPLLERLGLSAVLAERRSRLLIDDVDVSLMAHWIERAAERASGYDIIEFGPASDTESIEKYCNLQFQMNTAPLDDLIQDDEVLTPEIFYDVTGKFELRRIADRGLVAVERATGEFVGSTTILVDLIATDRGIQEETVVHPDHRNQGLGRWLKAANILRVMEEFPDLSYVDTFNAGSNNAMLGINVGMGYRPLAEIMNWQGDLPLVRERLGL